MIIASSLSSYALLGSSSALHEDAAFWSDSDTFDLAIVIGVADWLVGGGTFIKIRVERLALIEAEVQLSLRQPRLLGGRRFR